MIEKTSLPETVKPSQSDLKTNSCPDHPFLKSYDGEKVCRYIITKRENNSVKERSVRLEDAKFRPCTSNGEQRTKHGGKITQIKVETKINLNDFTMLN